MNNPRRFIEESFPVKEVGAALAKEKRIRHGHIRPLDLFVSQKTIRDRILLPTN
jgi:adenine-specific DNA methylase